MSLFKRKCSGSKQECEKPADSNDALEIALGVCIPVVVVVIVIAIVLFKVRRRAKREDAEDNDPDFDGDNTVLPDYPDKAEYYSRDNPFETNSALRYPAGAIESKDLHYQSNNTKMYSHYNSSTLNAYGQHVDSFVLPYTHDVGSKQSLDNLARALGSDYQGYRVASQSIDIGSRTSSFTSRPLTGYERSVLSGENVSATRLAPLETEEKSPFTSSSEGDADEKTEKEENFDEEMDGQRTIGQGFTHVSPQRQAGVGYESPERGSPERGSPERGSPQRQSPERQSPAYDQSPVRQSPLKYQSAVGYESAGDHDNELDNEFEEKNFEDQNNDYNYQSEVYQSPTKSSRSLNQSPAKTSHSVQPSSGSIQPSPAKTAYSIMPSHHGNDPEEADVPDLHDVIEEDNVPLTAEEDEQIQRMKSVYKVYFSRENSIKSKKSMLEEAGFDNSNMPPLPAVSSAAAVAPVREKPNLKVDTDYRASYASSVYTENPAPYQQSTHPQYPHQQIQNMLTAQEQERQRAYAEYNARSRGPPPQQPYVIAPSKPRKRMEAIPSPHSLENRKSSLLTFTEFQPNRKYSDKQHSSPLLNQKDVAAFNPIDNDYWSPTSPQTGSMPLPNGQQHQQQQQLAPHHFRNSVVMTNPVEITKTKSYRPAGSFTTAMDQSRSVPGSIPGSPSVSSGMFSPNVGYKEHFDDYQPPTAYTHGAQNLVTRSGSQQDLRKYIDNANI
ncbi:unnamed protein product [Kuraishia capsulata CBS 1993]|uniref:Uncharacterized protein n=1 Tax=Kuraishia capsulata CBS 1993 TaxID=1382522 RepID=W6MI82_9ASCO|nr:uncharacterized protein KUCA_T00001811001 [Kuraishia capsulata CBS 1993]CDK25841.1 unnamed protein product [Kuraishia capsulata CBS 1993]